MVVDFLKLKELRSGDMCKITSYARLECEILNELEIDIRILATYNNDTLLWEVTDYTRNTTTNPHWATHAINKHWYDLVSQFENNATKR